VGSLEGSDRIFAFLPAATRAAGSGHQ
jgi:hypothetical protein